MGGGFGVIAPLVGLLVDSVGGSKRNKSSSSGAAASRQAAIDAESRRRAAEDRRKRREDAETARQKEQIRLKKLKGNAGTLATGGAGLLGAADVGRTELKGKLGQ